nr:glycosyltransferase [Nocardioides dongxiaopingii]
MGTRGVPAHYGGFETAVEEIGARLADRGHEVVVYCRGAEDRTLREHRGMRLVHLPAVRRRSLETLSHSALSMGHAVVRHRPDVAFVFNAANAPLVPLLRLRRVPVAVHVDGLEWKRDKWSGSGQRFYRRAESVAVRLGDRLISDAQGIADYYLDEFGIDTDVITYGAPILSDPEPRRLAPLGLERHGYHLVVARFEPENHVLEILEGYRASSAEQPLVVVGSNPYEGAYDARLRAVAGADDRITLLGGVWDQDLLNSLYANALTYLHGHSVGGTNPSLLRAMGAAAPVIAYDVNFNREVLGDGAGFFLTPNDVARMVEKAESTAGETVATGVLLQARARQHYDWDRVAEGYEDLARRLAAGESTRGTASGRRRSSSAGEGVTP